MILAAALQMTSGAEKSDNTATAIALIRRAHGVGARFIGLPENFSWMGPEADRAGAAESLEGPTLSTLGQLARELQITLLAGSILEAGAPGEADERSRVATAGEPASKTGGRLFNTSVLFGPDGARLGVYRKIHLFDVEVGDGQTYRESAAVAPGTDVVVASAPFGKVGLSVCYDLRFPELYRKLSADGATTLTVPAAFTLATGKDHWEVLLRARAIENQAYVLAPAQQGKHPKDRMTWGHAMIVDPWGLVTARASEGQGMAVGQIDDELTARIRKSLPALSHRRL